MSRRSPPPPRAWQRMLSGRRLDILNPSPLDIEIEDIAHGLARVARWNGQTVGTHAFSVAQHSLVVEEIVRALAPATERKWLLAALLHDAPEYVIGDLITPFKARIGDDYKALEGRLLEATHLRFGLPAALPARISGLVKRADRIAAFYEATRLAGFEEAEAHRFFCRPKGLNREISAKLDALKAWPTQVAQKRYLERFAELAT